jgi:hypothetical protein
MSSKWLTTRAALRQELRQRPAAAGARGRRVASLKLRALRVPMNRDSRPFTRAQLLAAPCQILREGRWANARVIRATIDGMDWTVKDFRGRFWWVRNLLGRWLLRRELRALDRLAGIDGVPAQAFRVDAHAIAARFVPGVTLDRAPREQLNEGFFLALEALFRQVHARGLVHLDSRGSSNLLATPAGRPAVIDFQAALRTALLPPPLRRALEAVDMGGVYKNWLRHAPDSLDAGRRDFYERSTRLRRLWIGRGYFGVRKERQRGKRK